MDWISGDAGQSTDESGSTLDHSGRVSELRLAGKTVCGDVGKRTAEAKREVVMERCKGGILLEDVNRAIPSINCFTALLSWRSKHLLIIPVRNVYWIDCGGVNAFLNCEIASSWFWVREARRRQPCINGGGTWMAMENECW